MMNITYDPGQLARFMREFGRFDNMKEESLAQDFWRTLVKDVFQQRDTAIEYEKPVKGVGSIDVYIPETRVIIEQKAPHKKLDVRYTQSSGDELTPFEQAKRYDDHLGKNEKANWIVTSNFREIWIYDVRDVAYPEPVKLTFQDIEKQYHLLYFLVDPEFDRVVPQPDITTQAAQMMKTFYDELSAKYTGDTETLETINILCTRLVFCLYAEDTEAFGQKNIFFEYLTSNVDRTVDAIAELFEFFNLTDEEREARHPNYKLNKARLARFPYVNGDLFKREITIPPFIGKTRDTLGKLMGLDWSTINPTIFGSMFESTLNPETRHEGGMHYTSPRNIHKVIDPLFLKALHDELDKILDISVVIDKQAKLLEFQQKIASLRFLDPACGSGNFLTETYIELRKLENLLLPHLPEDNRVVRVSIHQFYGIEIHDFAVSVARVALWIAEHQMLEETKKIVGHNLPFFPLKTNPNIIEANALRIDWKEVVERVDYVMGNPPFMGTKYQTPSQKEDLLFINKGLKPLDYVCGWFYKASEYIQGTNTKCAFVSTNSITQGEQVAPLWKLLNVNIHFAYRTFKWYSESADMAQVHVVIIGFCCANDTVKYIFDGDEKRKAQNINGYLVDAPNVSIEKRSTPICKDVPKMYKGSQPTDGGNLLLSVEEREDLIKKNPKSEKYIKRYMGARDLINDDVRYCLWLVDATPNDIKSMPLVYERVKKCRESRLSSKKEDTRNWADQPTIFTENRQPDTDYLILPVVSSENRKYMPMRFVTKDVIANANAQMIPGATLYEFGILNSSVHNAWMRAICGRMKSDYAYSASIVYNNFPWPTVSDAQKEKIAQCGQKILDARAENGDSSLATLYDDVNMPYNLRKAHRENDRAVMQAYGFAETMTEAEIVAELMKLYQNLLSLQQK